MKKIIVLALVAILIAAAAGWALGPGYVKIVTDFQNTGAGVAGVESYTDVYGFGQVNLNAGGVGHESWSEISVYESVEVGDPGCWQGGCVELDKTVAMNWKAAAVSGEENTNIYNFGTDYTAWGADGTGSIYKNVQVDKYLYGGGGCWSGHCP